MNNFQSIAFSQQGRTVGIPRNDLTISFHYDPGRADLEFLQQAGQIEPVGNLFFFSVDL